MALKEKIPCPRCDAKGVIPRYFYNRKGLCFLCYGEKYIYVKVPEGADRDKVIADMQRKEKAHLEAHPPKVAMPDKIKNKAYDVKKEKDAYGKGGGVKEDATATKEPAAGAAKTEPKYAVGDRVTVTIPATRKNLEIKNVGATITGISGDRVKLAFNPGDARADADIRSRPGFPISVITRKETVIDRNQAKPKTAEITRDSDLSDVTNADLSKVPTEDLQILQQRIADSGDDTPERRSQAVQVSNAIFNRTDYKVNARDKEALAKKVEGNTYSQLKRKSAFLDKEMRDTDAGTPRHQRAKELKTMVEDMMEQIAAEYPEIKRTQMALPLLGGATVGQKFQILNKGDQVKVKLNGLDNSNEIVTAKVAGISQTKGQLRFDFDDDQLKKLNDLWLDPSYLNTVDAAAETPEEVRNLNPGDQIFHDGEWLTIKKTTDHTGYGTDTKGRTMIDFTDGTEAMKMPKTKVRTRKIKGPETAVKQQEEKKEAARVINDKVKADAEKMAAELDGEELEETIVYGVNSLAGMPAGPQSEILEYKLSVLVKKLNKTQAGFKKMPDLPKASDFDGSAAEAFKRGLSMNKADAQAARDKLKSEDLGLGSKLREYQRGAGFPEEAKRDLKQRQQIIKDAESRRAAIQEEIRGLEAAAKVTGMRRIMTGEDGPPKAAEPVAPKVRPNQLVSTVGPYQVTTRQHTRTKKTLYAIEPVNRVDMDEFRKMLQDLKENVGGFYDRKVFKRHLTAEDPTEALEKWLKVKAQLPGKPDPVGNISPPALMGDDEPDTPRKAAIPPRSEAGKELAEKIKGLAARPYKTEAQVREVGALVAELIEKDGTDEYKAFLAAADRLKAKLRETANVEMDLYERAGDFAVGSPERKEIERQAVEAAKSANTTTRIRNTLRANSRALIRESIFEGLGKVRSLGGVDLKYSSGDAKGLYEKFDVTKEYLPKDWLKALSESPLKMWPSKGEPEDVVATYRLYDAGKELQTHRITMSPRQHFSVAGHEIMHGVQRFVPGISAIEREFYNRRTEPEDIPDPEYPGLFTRRSTGRSFLVDHAATNYGPDSPILEILPIGFESLLEGGHRPEYRLENDPEYYHLILGLLAGGGKNDI